MPKDETEEITTKEGIVQLPKEEFDAIMQKFDRMAHDVEFLTSVADKKQVAQYYQRHKDKLLPNVKLRTMLVPGEDGNPVQKVIVGWKMTIDEVWKDPLTNAWKEKQELKLKFADGTELDMPLTEFTRRYKLVDCTRTGIEVDEVTGDTLFKLTRKDNGETYVVNVIFVN